MYATDDSNIVHLIRFSTIILYYCHSKMHCEVVGKIPAIHFEGEPSTTLNLTKINSMFN